MHVIEISPEKTPERFFLPRADDPTIHDVVSEAIDPASFADAIDAIRILRKRVYDGIAWFVFKADRQQIYWQRDVESTPRLVAEGQLVAQAYIGGTWRSATFDFATASISQVDTGIYRAVNRLSYAFGDVIFGQQFAWTRGNCKQTFYVDAPGQTVRLRWQCRVRDAAVAQSESDKGLRFSVADYPGTVTHTSAADPAEGWTQHIWTFEPDGYACPAEDGRTTAQRYADGAGLLVDPYIEVAEESTYIDVTCDGYIFRIANVSNEDYLQIRTPDNTAVIDPSRLNVRIGGAYYDLGNGSSNIAWAILENTPTRVILKVNGELTNSSGVSCGIAVELVFRIYSDFFITTINLITTSDVTIDNNGGAYGYLRFATGTATDRNGFEGTTSEAYTDNANECTTENYFGSETNLFNWWQIILQDDHPSYFFAFNRYESPAFYWNNITLTTGRHSMTVITYIDSVYRAGSAKLYSSTDRLAMGAQWKDLGIKFDNVSTAFGTNLEQITWNHTFGSGENRAALIFVASGTSAVETNPNSITIGGYAATLIDSRVEVANTREMSIWLLINPPTGVQSIVLTDSVYNARYVCTCVSLFGVNQATPLGTVQFEQGSGSPIAPLDTVLSAIGELVIDHVMASYNSERLISTDSDQTELSNHYDTSYSDGNSSRQGVSVKDGEQSTDMAWTSNGGFLYYAHQSVNIIPAMGIISGQKITDLNIPKFINNSGFAADGAIHVEPASGEVALTIDRTRYKQPIVIHDPHIYTGSVESPTDHLITHWRCDNTTLNVGLGLIDLGNATIVAGGKRGNCLQRLNAQTPEQRPRIINSGVDVSKGTIILSIKANGSASTSSNWLFHASNSFRCTVSQDFLLMYYSSNITFDLAGPDSLGFLWDGNYHTIHLCWRAGSFVYLFIDDSRVVLRSACPAAPSAVTDLYLGSDSSSVRYSSWFFDEIKIYDDLILPFGAYFTGNGAVDADVAHEDVLFYWDGSSANSNIPNTPLTGTSSGSPEFSTTRSITGTHSLLLNAYGEYYMFAVTSGNIVDKTEGSFSCWFYPEGSCEIIRVYIDSSNFFRLYYNATSNIFFVRWNYGGVALYMNSSTGAVLENAWNHIKFTWSATNVEIALYLNNKQEAAETYHALTGDIASINFGDTQYDFPGPVYLDGIYITNNPNTPQIPTVFGTPVHVPLIEVA